MVAVVITTIQKPRNFLAVVFTKVARAMLQNYHYAAQVLNAVTRLRPGIKHLRGSLHCAKKRLCISALGNRKLFKIVYFNRRQMDSTQRRLIIDQPANYILAGVYKSFHILN